MKPLRNLSVGTALTIVGIIVLTVGDPTTTAGVDEHPGIGDVGAAIIGCGVVAIAFAILEWITLFLMWVPRSLRARLRRSAPRKPSPARTSPPPPPPAPPPPPTRRGVDVPVAAKTVTVPPAEPKPAAAPIATGATARSAEPKRGKEPVQPASREVKVLMLGFKEWGKTLTLAALYKHFMTGRDRITLIADDKTERTFSDWVTKINDPGSPGFSDSTTEISHYSFRVRFRNAQGAAAEAFTLTYTDYAGELAENLLKKSERGEGAIESPTFRMALDEADILLGVLDGELVRRLLAAPQDDPVARGEIERLLRLLAVSRQRCIHLIISKWDLMVEGGRLMGIEEVVERLRAKSDGFDAFYNDPPTNLLRIIPVAALGRGFAEQTGPRGMAKVPGARWQPLYAHAPFYIALPDILAGDLNQPVRPAGRRGNILTAPGLAGVTRTILGLIGAVVTVTGSVFTITFPVADLTRGIMTWAAQRRERNAASGVFDETSALAAILDVCYARLKEPDFPSIVVRSHR
jgi:Double-GTPase 2